MRNWGFSSLLIVGFFAYSILEEQSEAFWESALGVVLIIWFVVLPIVWLGLVVTGTGG